MAAAERVEDDFESWLSFKLRSLTTDDTVFGSCISGILNEEATIEEKTGALEGILSDITEADTLSHCQEILEHWQHSQGLGGGESSSDTGSTALPAEDMDDRLVKLMESSTKATSVTKQYTAEDKEIKGAILAHYSQTSDHEFNSDPEVHVKEENGLEKNTNASAVAQAEREKRESAKIDSQKKIKKDKEDSISVDSGQASTMIDPRTIPVTVKNYRFHDWLHLKLKYLKYNEEIYGLYIQRIIYGDKSVVEKTVALQTLLFEIEETVDDMRPFEEILESWLIYRLYPTQIFPIQVLPEMYDLTSGDK